VSVNMYGVFIYSVQLDCRRRSGMVDIISGAAPVHHSIHRKTHQWLSTAQVNT